MRKKYIKKTIKKVIKRDTKKQEYCPFCNDTFHNKKDCECINELGSCIYCKINKGKESYSDYLKIEQNKNNVLKKNGIKEYEIETPAVLLSEPREKEVKEEE